MLKLKVSILKRGSRNKKTRRISNPLQYENQILSIERRRILSMKIN